MFFFFKGNKSFPLSSQNPLCFPNPLQAENQETYGKRSQEIFLGSLIVLQGAF